MDFVLISIKNNSITTNKINELSKMIHDFSTRIDTIITIRIKLNYQRNNQQ